MADRFGKDFARRLREEKRTRDPKGLLNPGKFFRIKSRYGNVLGLAMSPRLAKLGMAIAGPMLPWLARRAYRTPEGHGDTLERSTVECSACGACIPVCPAYLATNSEMVTGRGKLQVATRLLKGEPVSPEDAQSMFLCIHCGACERVCQSELPLVAAYDELEGLVAERFDVPQDRIAAFSRRGPGSGEDPQPPGAGGGDPARSPAQRPGGGGGGGGAGGGRSARWR